jgi:hypothetical protein
MEAKLLMVYDIKPEREAEYYRYMLGEFLPAVQNMGLIMTEGWHTAYGNYPMRLFAFRAEDDHSLPDVIRTEEWVKAKEKLLKLVRNYEERVVAAKNVFQFFMPSKK